jgi:branched-chain amino acid transport system permease protein
VVSPQVAELGLMVNLLAASVIGGRGKVSGALLGALLLVLVPEILRFAGNWYLFLWGAALLGMLILAPSGIAGALDSVLRVVVKPRWTVKPSSATNVPSAPADLRLQDMRKSFGGVVAVDGVTLQLRGGSALALIGPNGAGKTTLLNLICGTERVDSGRILWDDRDISNLSVADRARLGIGRSFQTSALPAGQAAIDAIACAVVDNVALDQARGQAMALLEELDIADQAYVAAEHLAPAVRRLVEIARARIGQPAVLALDEPTAGMNNAERAHLARLLIRWRDQGLALLVVEHDIAFASAVADELCCMEEGRIVAQGSPVALRADPSLARFFGAVRA